MLERLNKIRAITDGLLQSRPTLKNDYLETDDWTIIEEMIHLFKPFNEETLILSGASLPSSGSLRLIFIGLSMHHSQYIFINEAAKKMKDKLREHWTHLSKFQLYQHFLTHQLNPI